MATALAERVRDMLRQRRTADAERLLEGLLDDPAEGVVNHQPDVRGFGDIVLDRSCGIERVRVVLME